MATTTLGAGTISKGQSVRWTWNFRGVGRGPFIVAAVPLPTQANDGLIRVVSTGYETTSGGLSSNVFYSEFADIFCEAGDLDYVMEVTDFV